MNDPIKVTLTETEDAFLREHVRDLDRVVKPRGYSRFEPDNYAVGLRGRAGFIRYLYDNGKACAEVTRYLGPLKRRPRDVIAFTDRFDTDVSIAVHTRSGEQAREAISIDVSHPWHVLVSVEGRDVFIHGAVESPSESGQDRRYGSATIAVESFTLAEFERLMQGLDDYTPDYRL